MILLTSTSGGLPDRECDGIGDRRRGPKGFLCGAEGAHLIVDSESCCA
jgi:hypothetical protein